MTIFQTRIFQCCSIDIFLEFVVVRNFGISRTISFEVTIITENQTILSWSIVEQRRVQRSMAILAGETFFVENTLVRGHPLGFKNFAVTYALKKINENTSLFFPSEIKIHTTYI